MTAEDDTVYLDYNATAPVRPGVAAAVAEALAATGNPSSVHAAGRAARFAVEGAREIVADLVGASRSQIVFTGSGSEANNLALNGVGRPRVLVSAVEHDSAFGAVPHAEVVPVDADGLIDLEALDSTLSDGSDQPAVLSLMLANNETGVLQEVSKAAAMAHAYGALVHCDAVQAAGRVPVAFGDLGADLLSLSAHKLGGPQGVGALVVADHVALAPEVRGGGQEHGRRAGTENVPGIAGFGVAAAHARAELDDQDRIAALRDGLEAGIAATASDAIVFGGSAARLPNTTCVALPGIAAEIQIMALDLAGIAVSAGAACSSGKVTPSRVLRAMGTSEDLAGSAIRVSLGWASSNADVDRFLEAWGGLRHRAARRGDAAA